MHTRRCDTLLALVVVLASLVGGRARGDEAPTADAILKAKEHFAKGRQLFDSGDKAAAADEFKEAYKLSKNPLLLYNVGFVYDDLHDKSLAVHYYEKFLVDAPDNEKTNDNRSLAAERIKLLKKELAAEEQTQQEPPAPAQQPDQPSAPPTPPPVDKKGRTKEHRTFDAKDFAHTVVETAPPGKPLDITAHIPEEAAWKLVLYYRGAGQNDFQTVKMKPRYTEIVGRIPGEAMRGTSIQYYLEVKDDTGKLVASAGRASSPNIIDLDARAKSHFYEEPAGDSEAHAGRDDGEGAEDGARDEDGTARALSPPLSPRERRRKILRWGTAITSVAFLGTSLAFYMGAKDKSSQLEKEALGSATACMKDQSPPCRNFSEKQKLLEQNGKSYELLSNITLGLGVATAAVAGTLWYIDLTKKTPVEATAEATRRGPLHVRTLPLLGDGVVGGMAWLEF